MLRLLGDVWHELDGTSSCADDGYLLAAKRNRSVPTRRMKARPLEGVCVGNKGYVGQGELTHGRDDDIAGYCLVRVRNQGPTPWLVIEGHCDNFGLGTQMRGQSATLHELLEGLEYLGRLGISP